MADSYNLIDILPEGAVPMGYVASIKVLSPEGDVNLYHVKSPDLSTWEVVGMLTSALDDQRDILRAMPNLVDDDYDEDQGDD